MAPNQSIQAIQAEIKDEFSDFLTPQERYQAIFELGHELDALPDEFKTDAFKVAGCTSQVWLVPEFRDGCVFFRGDSDSIFVKGLVGLVIRVYSGHPPREIIDVLADFLREAGILESLTPNRSNGVAAMIKKMKTLAASFLAGDSK